jgi:hypothetical protein
VIGQVSDSLSARFEVLRGKVAALVVMSGEEEFVQTATDKALGGGVAATLALSGLAGAAVGAMLASSGSADSVQFFTCTVDGQRVAGRFSKVWFENGDVLEVVGAPQRDGSFAAYAVRRAGDRTLWMLPHCSRGNRAHWTYTLKMIPVITAGVTVAGCMFFSFLNLLSPEKAPPDLRWILFWLVAANSLAIGLYFPIKIARKWRSFVAIAEQVFAALGYANPSRIDMEKQDSMYWKKYAKPGEQRKVAPWVFRYVDEK